MNVTGEGVGGWKEVHVGISPHFVSGQVVLIFLEFLLVPLQVLHHQILPHQLVVIRVVVHDLCLIEPDPCLYSVCTCFGIEKISDCPHCRPIEVPLVLVFLSLGPPSLNEVIDHHFLVKI